MRTSDHKSLLSRTRDYYNSTDADNFYLEIWGGEDIHIGIYQEPGEPIATASRRTVTTMVSKLPALGPGMRVLDLGSGYGGSARHLASTTGCHVTCLNLSETQNTRNRERNAAAGLEPLIEVVDGSFEDLPFAGSSFDVVWSQDAFLHSSRRTRILEEVDRVLQPGGHLVFTDPMQMESVPGRDLKPVLSRLQLDSLGSVDSYRRDASSLGWLAKDIHRMPEQLVNHYRNVHAGLAARREELSGRISGDYISRMLAGLMHWVEAGRAQRLDWGILHFLKPRSAK